MKPRREQGRLHQQLGDPDQFLRQAVWACEPGLLIMNGLPVGLAAGLGAGDISGGCGGTLASTEILLDDPALGRPRNAVVNQLAALAAPFPAHVRVAPRVLHDLPPTTRPVLQTNIIRHRGIEGRAGTRDTTDPYSPPLELGAWNLRVR